MKNNNDKWIGTAGILLAFAVVLFALSFYASILDQMLSKQIWSNLDNVARQSVYNVQSECYNQIHQMEDMARHLGMQDVTQRSEIQPLLEQYVSRNGFKRIGFAQLDGSTYTTDESDLNVMQREYFQKGLRGETGISNRIQDYVDRTPTMVFDAPVYDRDGKLCGVVFAAYEIQELRRILRQSVFQEDFGFVIMNESGDIMVSDVIPSDGEVLNIASVFTGEDNVLPELKNILYTVDTKGSYAMQDQTYYVHFSALQVNGWYFVAVARTEIITGVKNRIMLATYILCFVMVAMALALVLYMMHRERQKNQEMSKVLYEDALTGGYSYQRFREKAMKALAESKRNAAFIIMDIDQFKLINELFGVKSGDDTLRYLNQLWMDWIQPPEVFARRSADCFGALAFYDEEEELLERIDDFVERVLDNDSNIKGSYVLRPHLGIYLIQSKDEDFESMQNNAAIVHGMMKGNNSVYYGIFDRSFKERTVQNKILEDQLEQAYRSKEYTIYYQPKYDAHTCELCGAEALIRWRKRSGELIPPGTFIPLAEKKGMVEKLDRYVFEEVCLQMREWKAGNKKVVPVSVNLSRENLKNHSLVEDYINIRVRNELDAEDVELELTESALFENLERAKPLLDKLRDHGFRILMDDFGTGYSSLMMLKTLPVDVVKLDKSFVDDYNNERGEQIIQCVVGMMNSLHMRVTAEGVETKEQYEFLRDLGCDTIQGYYFARPMPAEEFAKLLRTE